MRRKWNGEPDDTASRTVHAHGILNCDHALLHDCRSPAMLLIQMQCLFAVRYTLLFVLVYPALPDFDQSPAEIQIRDPVWNRTGAGQSDFVH